METSSRSTGPPPGGQHHGHAHFWERALSRGVFLRTAALTAGVAASGDLWRPAGARAAARLSAGPTSLAQLGAAAPKPIPGGFNPGVPGGPALLHVNLPASSTDDQITITDFAGEMGVAHLQGTGTDGTGNALTYDADMRFMRGVYVGTDGNRHVATFGFVWLDLFQGPVASGVQIHDFEPGIAPNGVFWTIPVPYDAVHIDLKAQTASFAYDSLAIPDFGNFVNAITAATSQPGVATFNVQWSGTTNKIAIRNTSQGFAGMFFQDTATIEFTVASPVQNNFRFTSDPAHTSTSLFAQIGLERNGVFFRG